MEDIEKEDFPSKEFGIHTGLRWIYVDWILPMDADAAGQFLRRYLSGQVSSSQVSYFYLKILELNPELKSIIGRKSKISKYHICMGVVSKFNLDDITFYSMPFDRNIIISYNQSNMDVKRRIIAKAGCDIGWVMSPTTRSRVIKELDVK